MADKAARLAFLDSLVSDERYGPIVPATDKVVADALAASGTRKVTLQTVRG